MRERARLRQKWSAPTAGGSEMGGEANIAVLIVKCLQYNGPIAFAQFCVCFCSKSKRPTTHRFSTTLMFMGDVPFSAQVVRALTADGQIRLSAMNAASLWDGARRGHPHLEADACAMLVELLTAAALLQSRSLLAERIQLVLRSDGRAKAIVADSWPDGSVRGILDLNPECGRKPWITFPGNFQVIRSNPNGPPYIGNIELIDGPISSQVEHYLQQSEQIQACVALWCDPFSGEAGGLIVEPLPGCPAERLKRMLAALDGLEVSHLWERTPDFIVNWINQGEGAEILSSLNLEYRCRCSKQSLVDTLSIMPLDQRQEIFYEKNTIEAHCEYCGKSYAIAQDELSGA
jgi:molecular chaperone Hsp33